MRWAGDIARMEERRGAYRVLVRRPEGKNHLEDLSVNESMICLQEVGWGHGVDRSGSRQGQVAGSCRCDSK